MTLAERIRELVNERYLAPARAANQDHVSVRTGDVHAELGLAQRMPAVCGALDAAIFETQYGARLVSRTGPHHGANVVFTFSLLGPTLAPPTAPPRPPAMTRPTSDGCFLVSCVAAKRTSAAMAKDLYVSDWFVKARAHVERIGARWFILSAEHGLVDPTTVIAPYERTLNAMSSRERLAWAERVIVQMKEQLPGAERIIVFAGERYREHLMGHLRSISPDVQVPMEGLRIGEQLSWLGRSGPSLAARA
jgi:hypothetical protein